jgi:hypothetical protein
VTRKVALWRAKDFPDDLPDLILGEIRNGTKAMSNNERMSNDKRSRCKNCGRMYWFNDGGPTLRFSENDADLCSDCYKHRNDHPNYDPRCVVCVADRITAQWKALAIVIGRELAASDNC